LFILFAEEDVTSTERQMEKTMMQNVNHSNAGLSETQQNTLKVPQTRSPKKGKVSIFKRQIN